MTEKSEGGFGMILCYIYDTMADFEVSFLLHRLKNQGKREIVTVAKSLEPVTSQSGVRFLPHRTIDSIQDTKEVEALLIPGGPVDNEKNEICPLVKRLTEEGKLVGAICFGPQFLGRAGILDQYTFTTSCSPEKVKNEFHTWDPYNWDNFVPARVHRDRNVITAQGYAFVDFAGAVCDYLGIFESAEERFEMIGIVKAEEISK